MAKADLGEEGLKDSRPHTCRSRMLCFNVYDRIFVFPLYYKVFS